YDQAIGLFRRRNGPVIAALPGHRPPDHPPVYRQRAPDRRAADGWRDRTLSPVTDAHRRRQGRGALPQRSAIELEHHAVGGIDRALVLSVDPDAARIVHPGARRLPALGDDVELPAV